MSSGPTQDATDPFDPADASWTPVSPRLVGLRRLLLLLPGVPIGLGLAAVAAALTRPLLGVVVLLVMVLSLGWLWRVVARSARSWGYAERAEDLLVRRGVLFRQLVVVPYGRMQFVDVQVGPLERAYGIATVRLHTAAAASDARIPGLPPAEAARLRDRLASRGEAQSAGL